jgi:peptidoglycan hydrolase-like protein with peptidoglycan-binding domain/3D (Asp-Asp-Asp) domain-containing protein
LKTKIKKIIGFLLPFMLFAGLVQAGMAESRPMEVRKLLVTAYYSPLPGQAFYMRGSYEADIRLNGRGTNGADGTQVYAGMLAAPRTYPFGTRVNIPGLGVGEVHDRGGAIFAHRDYDRIDVWMGQGEEGLARALNWGARLVEGEVYFTPHQAEPLFSFSWVSPILPPATETRLRNRTLAVSQPAPVVTPLAEEETMEDRQVPEEETPQEESKEIVKLRENAGKLAAGLGKDASGEEVLNLQRMLWELGYYDGPLNGDYDMATIDAVYLFQTENGVLQSERDLGAGYFGKRTLVAMASAVEARIDVLADYPKEAQVWVPAKKILPEIAALEPPDYAEERQELYFPEDLLNKKIVQHEMLKSELDLHDQNDQVAILQRILIAAGYLEDGLDTGYFGPKTENAVLAFQMANGIVFSPVDAGAGRVGPKTLSALNSL